jgi:hypothetical protein
MNASAQCSLDGVSNGEEKDETEGKRRSSPLAQELGATRRIIETIEALPETARLRVLEHVSAYIRTPKAVDQLEFDL